MSITHEIGPYAIVPLWLLDALVERKATAALRTYVALHRWTSARNGDCYPSRAAVASAVGASPDTVDRDVATLVELGALTVERRWTSDGDPTSNRYTIRAAHPEWRADRTPSPSCPQGSRTDAATLRTGAVGGSRTDAARGSRTDAALNQYPVMNQTTRARRTGAVPEPRVPRQQTDLALCTPDHAECDGTGWVHVDHNTVEPCSRRKP